MLADHINHVIRNRRSVKPELFIDKAIPENDILALLENARWAPTHGMTQPWRFKVFTGEGALRLGEFHGELYQKETDSEKFSEVKLKKLINRHHLASHIISIGLHRQDLGKIPEIEEVAAVSCAVHNICLSAFALGISTYWGSGGMTFHSKMKSFLGLRSQDKVMGFLFLGYSEKKMLPPPRLPIGEFTTWVTE